MIIPSRSISDEAYGESWNGITTFGASKNALYDKLATAAEVSDTAYNSTTWDGVTAIAPSKNAVRDKVETLAAKGDNTDITSMNGMETGMNNCYITQGVVSRGTGAGNTFVQAGAAGEVTNNAYYNTSIGYYSCGIELTTGDYNTCVGSYAGASISAQASTTLVGYNAGLNSENSGNNNTAIGRGALEGVSGGTGNNVAIGMYAGRGDNSCLRNSTIAIGYNSLQNTNSTGTIAIGTDTVLDEPDTTNCIYIGNGITTATETPNNEIVIGQGGVGAGDDTITLGSTSTTDVIIEGQINLYAPDGILFPDVTSESSTAKVLDDYEQGTFTPTITGSSSSSGLAYTTQLGRYRKIGNWVTVWGRIVLSSVGSCSGDISIASLPFTHLADEPHVLCNLFYEMVDYGESVGNITRRIQAYIAPTNNYIKVGYTEPESGTTRLPAADLTNTSTFMFQATYRVE